MRDLARVRREALITRADLTEDMPISVRQLRRSLTIVSLWLQDAIKKIQPRILCDVEADK
jgi:hypothetical protein